MKIFKHSLKPVQKGSSSFLLSNKVSKLSAQIMYRYKDRTSSPNSLKCVKSSKIW